MFGKKQRGKGGKITTVKVPLSDKDKEILARANGSGPFGILNKN